jgi:hypothetical protein
MSNQKPTRLATFASLNWYDETIKFVFNFVAKTSELLLAAGVVVSSANFLTDGAIMPDHTPLSVAWAWAQALAIDSSLGIVFVNGFQAIREHGKVKAVIFFTLTAMLAAVAGLLTNFDALSHATGLPVTDKSISGVIPLWILTALRALAVIGFLLVSRLKQFSFRGLRLSPAQEAQATSPTMTPEWLNELLALLRQTIVSEEQARTPQIAEAATTTDEPEPPPVALFPAVSEEERNKVIVAYQQGIPRREICAFLHWGNAKYTTIVKPVLDAYEQQEQQAEAHAPECDNAFGE